MKKNIGTYEKTPRGIAPFIARCLEREDYDERRLDLENIDNYDAILKCLNSKIEHYDTYVNFLKTVRLDMILIKKEYEQYSEYQ